MLLALLFYLLAAHALMDYALQSEAIAACKCRGSDHPAARTVPWYYWLTAHAVLHGAAVGVVVQWFGFGWNAAFMMAAAETVLHWATDHAKCLGWFNIHVDQAIHIACKLLWWALLAGGVMATPAF